MDDRREWRRQYQKDYRQDIDNMCKRLAVVARRFMEGEIEAELDVPDRTAPADHKCWHCTWATWCGDRFFCPLYEVCIKKHREEANDSV